MGSRRQRRRSARRAAERQGGIRSLFYVLVPALVVVLGGLGAWALLRGAGGTGGEAAADGVELPKYVETRAEKEAYVFAMERPDVLAYMPCYCNCGASAGHTSNLDCFVKGKLPDGTIVFDSHGAY